MTDFNTEEFKTFTQTHGTQLDTIGLPQHLRSRLFQKLQKEEFDIGNKVKIIIDPEGLKMIGSVEKIDEEEDVYLIDHAWTFRYYEAYEFLKSNKKLRYRMKNIMSNPDKIDLTDLGKTGGTDETAANAIPEEYKEERPNLIKYLETMPDGPTVYNLDDYGILNLDNIPFKEDATEISLFGNKLHDPYTITDNLGKMEDLKALWLNDNPIEDNCHNFDEIGEFFQKLEIINSKFTSKAGEWAVLFCCKDQKVDKLEDIEYLDLSGREFLKMKDITLLERLTSLKTIDISDHKYLLSSLTEEILGTAELEHEGQKFEVTSHSHNFNQFMSKIPQVKNIICDDEVAEHIIKENNAGRLSDVLPNLKTINGFSIPSSFKDYKVEMEIKYIMKHLWKFTNSYK